MHSFFFFLHPRAGEGRKPLAMSFVLYEYSRRYTVSVPGRQGTYVPTYLPGLHLGV